MARYMLSVHSVEGDVREPPTAEQMEHNWQQLGIVEAEMKSTGAWVFSGRLDDPDTATVVRVAHGEILTTDGPFDEATIGHVFRENSGRAVAALIRVFGDIDVAEDAVQEAFAIALRRWPADGLPPNPGGWITTTARNRALDRLRRESRERELLARLAAQPSSHAVEEAGPVH